MILDVDGTLIDSSEAHARAWVNAFAAHGITVPYEPVRRAIGMGGDKHAVRFPHRRRLLYRRAHQGVRKHE